MSKDKMFLKIELLPKEHPCHDCIKGCMGEEFLKCKKLKAFENKKICKAYDYDKAIKIIARVYGTSYKAEAALKALLEGAKK